MSKRCKTPKVRYVNGEKVRHDHVEFTMGCHRRAPHCKFIPANEIWIEKNMTCIDTEATILHEMVEHTAMCRGYGYDEAHEMANKVERKFRRNDLATREACR